MSKYAELRRRSPGDRLLVYLDVSTLSDLAVGKEEELRELLASGVQEGRLLCPESDAVREEVLLAGNPELREAVHELAVRLSLGVGFEQQQLIEWSEIEAAAAAFLGKEPLRGGVWREAFRKDPQTPIEKLRVPFFVVARWTSQDWERAEVQHEKDKEMLTESIYVAAQAERRGFEEQARREQEAMIDWKLGPLFDPAGFADKFQRRTMEAASEMGTAGAEAMLEPGSSYGRYSALYMLKVSNEGLIERHPELLERQEEFRSLLLTGPVPALRLPALLRGALSVTKGRRPRPSDVYDVLHLTRGLSRCDIVTSDAGMVQLCRDYGLVLPGVELYSPREVDQLTARIEESRARPG